jgi:uncharacterized membrane protein
MFVFGALFVVFAALHLPGALGRRPAWLGSSRDRLRVALTATFLLTAGTRLVSSDTLLAMIPSGLPFRRAALYLSGLFEALGALGLLVPRLRRAAGWGLAALLLAVFPANVNVALNNLQIANYPGSALYQWARLPLQLALIWLTLWAAGDGARAAGGRAERAGPPAPAPR